MTRRPPRSTLFPSTTLFRSGLGLAVPAGAEQLLTDIAARPVPGLRPRLAGGGLRPPGELRQVAHEAEDAEKQAHVAGEIHRDRKSTRLNSSHANISYAVFCL